MDTLASHCHEKHKKYTNGREKNEGKNEGNGRWKLQPPHIILGWCPSLIPMLKVSYIAQKSLLCLFYEMSSSLRVTMLTQCATTFTLTNIINCIIIGDLGIVRKSFAKSLWFSLASKHMSHDILLTNICT